MNKNILYAGYILFMGCGIATFIAALGFYQLQTQCMSYNMVDYSCQKSQYQALLLVGATILMNLFLAKILHKTVSNDNEHTDAVR